MKRIRKLLSLLMVLCMSLSMIPGNAIAQDPDQAAVTFQIVNGTWKDETDQPITLTVPLKEGKGTLEKASVPEGMLPHEGFTKGAWEPQPNVEENGITADVTYTYRFAAAEDPDN